MKFALWKPSSRRSSASPAPSSCYERLDRATRHFAALKGAAEHLRKATRSAPGPGLAILCWILDATALLAAKGAAAQLADRLAETTMED